LSASNTVLRRIGSAPRRIAAIAVAREGPIDFLTEGARRSIRVLFVQWNCEKKCRHCRIGTGRLGAAHHRETASERFLNNERKPFALAGQDEEIARLIERRNRRPAQIGKDDYVRQLPIAWVSGDPSRQTPT
jgi:hypothetical protein